MATDPVFTIVSMTQALAGVCAMQLVEEGKISRSAPAKKYVTEIARLQLPDGFGPGVACGSRCAGCRGRVR